MIYLTGAGCGDVSLLTLKAKYVLQQADCVLYDRLLDPSVLSFVSDDCERIYVGKRMSHHAMKQEDINALLVEKGKTYRCVVRLKGGDPYVFGRGSEEALYLYEHGIDFEVIPGITSAIAGCSAAGIPVTHRGVALGVRIMSAHNKEDQFADMDFSSMAHTNDTLVFLMGLFNVEKIVSKLLDAGKAETTPISVISNASRSNQRMVTSTLKNILKEDMSDIVSPAIIVVGNVIQYQNALNFYDRRILQNKCYIMASLQKEDDLAFAFMMKGADFMNVRCGHVEALQHDIDPSSFSHILFTSRNAIRIFFEKLLADGNDVRMLSQTKLCAIGNKTAQYLKTYGCQADIINDVADSKHFGEYMKKRLSSTDRVLILKAENHKHDLYEALKDVCTVKEIGLYKTCRDVYELQEMPVDGMLFTCSFGVHALMETIKYWNHYQNIKVYAIGEPTKRALQEYGFQHIITLKEADKQLFLDAVIKEETKNVSR